MKSNIIHFAIAGISAMLLTGCVGAKFAEQNITNEELSLSRKGSIIISYNPAIMQISYNPDRQIYRIHDDHMGEYYILSCSEMPTVKGQTLKADLQYTTSNNTVTENNLSFEVQKTDDTGKIWLWNQSKKYGIVIKQL